MPTGIDRRLQPVVGSLADAHDRGLEKIYRPLGIIAMLGTVALLLSFIGLVGLASYTVAQRTKEIGLRMALGAGSTQIVCALLAPMTVPVGAGLLCGILGGSAVVRVLRSGIAGIVGLTVFDPWAYLGAMVFSGCCGTGRVRTCAPRDSNRPQPGASTRIGDAPLHHATSRSKLAA